MEPIEIIRIRNASFASIANVNSFIQLASEETGDVYGTKTEIRNRAIALLAMHFIALSQKDSDNFSTPGSVISEKEGQLSRQYSTMDAAKSRNAFLAQTSWGLELLDLRDSFIITPMNRFSL